MKKFKLILTFAMVMVMAFTFVLTACTPTPPVHTHNYVEGKCTVCGEDDPNYQPPDPTCEHTYVDGVCTKCGGTDPNYVPPSKIKATINSDGTVTYNYAANTEINVAIGYEKESTAITFKGLDASVKLPSGTYANGDLKPTWQTLQSFLGVKFVDSYTGANRQNEFSYWKSLNYTDTTTGNIDVLIGRVGDDFNVAGRAGHFLNIAEYLDYMPNYKAFLEANPIVYLSLLADNETGAMYAMPYFDGNNDIERMYMMQVHMVEALLNGEGAYAKTATNVKPMNTTVAYTPYMPTEGTVEVDVIDDNEATGVKTIAKDYDAVATAFASKDWYTGESGNIVDIAAAYRKSTGATYEGLVNVLREYIEVAYNGYYGENRGDLFVGEAAAWDADELAVLLHCVVGSAYEFNTTGVMNGIFCRDNSRTDRLYDIMRLAGHMFGVRGIESRTGYTYFDKDGVMQDARQEISIYEASLRMNALHKEGLIQADLDVDGAAKIETKGILPQNEGFMIYDYVQTQTVQNTANTSLQPVINPVALWFDGTDANGTYMRFTESWRSVKDDACGITKAVEDDPDLLAAVLRMFDYMYTEEGRILMTYGPEQFYDGTIDYNGRQEPKLIDAITNPAGEFYFNNLNGVGGSYSTYARTYIGSTLCVCEKMQSFEYQLTDVNGREGEGRISKAIGLGLIKHPELSIQENMWYTLIPTSIMTTALEDEEMTGYTNISGKSQFFSTSNGQYNIFVQIIKGTVAENGVITLGKANGSVDKIDNLEAFVANVRATTGNGWKGGTFLYYMNEGWKRQINYYNDHIAK